jgi:prefoldin subunit 5
MSDSKRTRLELIQEQIDRMHADLESLHEEMEELQICEDDLYIQHAWSFMNKPDSRIIVPIGVN